MTGSRFLQPKPGHLLEKVAIVSRFVGQAAASLPRIAADFAAAAGAVAGAAAGAVAAPAAPIFSRFLQAIAPISRFMTPPNRRRLRSRFRARAFARLFRR